MGPGFLRTRKSRELDRISGWPFRTNEGASLVTARRRENLLRASRLTKPGLPFPCQHLDHRRFPDMEAAFGNVSYQGSLMFNREAS